MSRNAHTLPEPAPALTAHGSGAPVRHEIDDVCVVLPMLNEAGVITEVVTRVREAFPHVVCVDDGSSDNSVELAAAAGAVVVRHPVNLGQGAALQTGIEFALRSERGYAYILTFDADGQHRVEDALTMVAEARRAEVDVVLGSRFLTAGRRVPVGRRLLLRGAVAFTRLTTGLALTDAHNGLRVLSRAAASALDLRLNGMAHASEILNVIAREKFRYAEVPIDVLYTDYSRAKGQSSVNAVNIVFDLMADKLRVAR